MDKNEAYNTCDILNPTEDLTWLKSSIVEIGQDNNNEWAQYAYIQQASYNNNTVFVFRNCCPLCNTIVPVKNCLGETIGIMGIGEDHIEFDQLLNKKTLWKSTTSLCEL